MKRLFGLISVAALLFVVACGERQEAASTAPSAATSSAAARPDPSPAKVLEKPNATEAPRELPPGVEAPGGFVMTGEPEQAEPNPASLTAEEQGRYDACAVRLIQAINAEDAESYRALFTDAGWKEAIPWWREMFSAQTSRFGPIVRAWPATRATVRMAIWGFAATPGHRAPRSSLSLKTKSARRSASSWTRPA